MKKRLKTFLSSLTKRNMTASASALAVLSFVVFFMTFLILDIFLSDLLLQSVTIIAFINIFNSYFFYRAIVNMIREPDYVFNYGYGKYESLSIFLSVILYLIGIVFLIFFGINRFDNFIELSNLDYFKLLIVLLFSFSNFRFYKLQKNNYKEFKIESIRNNYLYYKKLTYISIAIFIIFSILIFFDFKDQYLLSFIIEAATSIIVIVILLLKPISELKNAFDQLTDKNLPEHIQYDLIAVVAENLNRMCRYNTMHTRQSGNDIFIELDIVLPWDYTIEQKYDLEKDIKQAILNKYPNSIIRLYVVPCEKDCYDEHGNYNCPLKRNL